MKFMTSLLQFIRVEYYLYLKLSHCDEYFESQLSATCVNFQLFSSLVAYKFRAFDINSYQVQLISRSLFIKR